MPTPEEKQFRRICKAVEAWPDGCADDAERDTLLRAGKAAFAEGTLVCEGLRILYLRFGILRPIVDMLCQSLSAEVGTGPGGK